MTIIYYPITITITTTANILLIKKFIVKSYVALIKSYSISMIIIIQYLCTCQNK